MSELTPSEALIAIAQEHADGVRAAHRAKRPATRSDSEIGVSQVVGDYHDRSGTLRVIAVRRSERERYDVVEVASNEAIRLLASVHGTDAAAEEHAFTVAAQQLAQAKQSA